MASRLEKKSRKQHQSANGSIGGLGPGGLDSWDPLMKGIVTKGLIFAKGL